ncbi:DUF7504 family protein [Halomicrococcus gelatinilyticus]|uniref:DUF7504 family protein n=1 Tax=Halomicrococcus gelatinilyticus TaxID=1702103 RepID=UPI002E0F7CD9
MLPSRSPLRGDDAPPDIDTYLQRLKRQGSLLLVTGTVDETISGIATRRLLGDPHCDRKRVLAFADAVSDDYVDYCLPSGTTRRDADVRVATPDGTRRGDPESEGDAAGRVDRTDAERLRRGLTRAIAGFDANVDLDPAELRVGVVTLVPFLDATDRSGVERLVRTLGEIVRGLDGMAHVHLPVADTAPVVDDLSPLFDARIELRQRETFLPEQRWHVPRYGITTVWTEI